MKLIQKIFTCTCNFASVYDRAFQSVFPIQGNVSEMGVGKGKKILPWCWESAFLFSLWHSELCYYCPKKKHWNVISNYFFPTIFFVWLKLYYIRGKAHTVYICAYIETTIYYQTCTKASQFIYSWMALKLDVSCPSVLVIRMTAGVRELLVLFNCLTQEAFNKKKWRSSVLGSV